MHIVFLGLMFCDDALKHEMKIKNKNISMASHLFQLNMVKGLMDQPEVTIEIVNVPPTGSFPINHKKLYSKSYTWGKSNKQIGYLNLPKVKHIIQCLKIYQHVKQKISNYEKTYLLVYSLYPPFLYVAKKIKEIFPNVHVCLIHTDAVPGRNDMEKYMTKEAKRRGDRAIRLTRDTDSYVLLTKHLVEPLEIGGRPYEIVECICNEEQQPSKKDTIIHNSFLYTGAINKAYGICELVNAFKKMPDAELWICGEGDAKNTVVTAASLYSNIKYYGFTTQEVIKKLQDKCAFLINPRRPSGTYTMYSFPSKTAEYMMSGKPVVMYKLEGVPDEYDNYLLYLTATNSVDLMVELSDIMLQPYNQLLIQADKAREFMINNKTSSIIGRKIVSFLNKVTQ